LVWRQEGHPVSKNKSLQTTPNNESQDLIGGGTIQPMQAWKNGCKNDKDVSLQE